MTAGRQAAVAEAIAGIRGRASGPFHESGVAARGERGMVEPVGMFGFCRLAAPTRDAFEPGIPGSIAPRGIFRPGGIARRLGRRGGTSGRTRFVATTAAKRV